MPDGVIRVFVKRKMKKPLTSKGRPSRSSSSHKPLQTGWYRDTIHGLLAVSGESSIGIIHLAQPFPNVALLLRRESGIGPLDCRHRIRWPDDAGREGGGVGGTKFPAGELGCNRRGVPLS